MSVFCPSCGKTNPDGAAQCAACGTSLAAPSPQGGFGAPPPPPGGGFGGPPPPPGGGFGAPPRDGFGASPAPAGGGWGTPAPGGGFGGQNTPPPGGGFGAHNTPPPGGFGAQNTPPAGGFGAPAPGGSFGAPSAPGVSSGAPKSGGVNKLIFIPIGCGVLCVMCCVTGAVTQLACGSMAAYTTASSPADYAPPPAYAPTTAPALPFPVAAYPPANYPVGFPWIAGGAPDPATSVGTPIILYADPPTVIFERFVAEFQISGWQMVGGTEMTEGGYRFAASSGGRVVRLMAMPEGGGTMLGVHED